MLCVELYTMCITQNTKTNQYTDTLIDFYILSCARLCARECLILARAHQMKIINNDSFFFKQMIFFLTNIPN